MLERYMRDLIRYRGRPVWTRVLQGKKMMYELKKLNEDIDSLLKILNLATTGALMDWKNQWEVDRVAQQNSFATLANSSHHVLSEMSGVKAQLEAMMVLLHALKSGEYDPETLKPAKKMLETIVSASSIGVPTLYPWFIPQDDVVFDPEPFARGAFGAVHRGTWGSGAKVVVKTLLLDETSASEAAKKQFLDEINIWFKLHHPNVVKMYGASHVTTPPFIVCEDATKGNLANYLCDATKSARQDMWRLLYEAALGLECLHKHRVVHGDLKLNNVLIGSDGAARIADFGLSFVSASSKLSQDGTPGSFVGSGGGGMRWRAPECLTRRPTFSSDVYSLAMCIIEAVSAEPPYSYAGDDIVYHLKTNGKIPEQPPGMTNTAWQLVVSMTVQDPSQRCRLEDVISTLRQFVEARDPSGLVKVADLVDETETTSHGVSGRASQYESRPVGPMTVSAPPLVAEVSVPQAASDVASPVSVISVGGVTLTLSSNQATISSASPSLASKPPDGKIRPVGSSEPAGSPGNRSAAAQKEKSAVQKMVGRLNQKIVVGMLVALSVVVIVLVVLQALGVLGGSSASSASISTTDAMTPSSTPAPTSTTTMPTTSAPSPTPIAVLTAAPPATYVVTTISDKLTPPTAIAASSDGYVYIATGRAIYRQLRTLPSGTPELYAGSVTEGELRTVIEQARVSLISPHWR